MTTANDSRWEPDGVTLQVRFCEGSTRGRPRVLLLTQSSIGFCGDVDGHTSEDFYCVGDIDGMLTMMARRRGNLVHR